MDHELQTMQKGAVHAEGRRRLRLLLCGLGGLTCAGTMALVLVFYGAPFNPLWWWVMAAILLGATIVPALFAPIIEWVIAGYLRGSDQAR